MWLGLYFCSHPHPTATSPSARAVIKWADLSLRWVIWYLLKVPHLTTLPQSLWTSLIRFCRPDIRETHGKGKHLGVTKVGSRVDEGSEEDKLSGVIQCPSFLSSFQEPRGVEVGAPGLSYRLREDQGSAGLCLRSELSAWLFQGIDNLLQDIGAVVCDLLENRVGVLLQLSALLLTHLQLPLQLEENTLISFF